MKQSDEDDFSDIDDRERDTPHDVVLPMAPLDDESLVEEYALFELVPLFDRSKTERTLQQFLNNRGYIHDPTWSLRIKRTKHYKMIFTRLQQELCTTEARIAAAYNTLEQVSNNPMADPRARVQAARTILEATGVAGSKVGRPAVQRPQRDGQIQMSQEAISRLTDEELSLLLQQEEEIRKELQ